MPPIKAAFPQGLPTSLSLTFLTPRNRNVRDKSSTPRHCNISQVLINLLPVADCPLVGLHPSPSLSITPYWFRMHRGHFWGTTQALRLLCFSRLQTTLISCWRNCLPFQIRCSQSIPVSCQPGSNEDKLPPSSIHPS